MIVRRQWTEPDLERQTRFETPLNVVCLRRVRVGEELALAYLFLCFFPHSYSLPYSFVSRFLVTTHDLYAFLLD